MNTILNEIKVYISIKVFEVYLYSIYIVFIYPTDLHPSYRSAPILQIHTHHIDTHPPYRLAPVLQISTHTTDLHPSYRSAPILQIHTHHIDTHPPYRLAPILQIRYSLQTLSRHTSTLQTLAYPTDLLPHYRLTHSIDATSPYELHLP